jgi:hypothetical protein
VNDCLRHINHPYQLPANEREWGGGAGCTWSAFSFEEVEKRRKALLNHLDRATTLVSTTLPYPNANNITDIASMTAAELNYYLMSQSFVIGEIQIRPVCYR